MRKVKYNVGDNINGFLFLSEIEQTPRIGTFLCKYCGSEFKTKLHSISSGHTKSCGCMSNKLGANKRTVHGHNTRAGKSGEYTSWECMINRCYNEKHPNHTYYSGFGIIVCDRWKNSFENFLADMGPKPTPEHTLDRFPNQHGIYEPINCRWASKVEQSDNRVNVKLLEYNNKKQSMARWSEDYSISYNILRNRIKRGDTIEQAIQSPYIPRNRRKAEVDTLKAQLR